MRALPSSALLAALVLSSCSLAVDVDDYTFDVSPCGPRPPSCSGGREIAFALSSLVLPSIDGEGRRDGFDFDGTDATICGRGDFDAPDGRIGVDNGLVEVLELYQELAGVDLRADAERAIVEGGPIQLLVLSGVDDPMNDDCIEVTRRAALRPAGIEIEDLDTDGDGVLDEGLTFDYLTPTDRDPVACSIDGVLHARFPTSFSVIYGTTVEANVDRGRLRMPLDHPDAPTDAMVGGSVRIADLVGGLPDAVVEFIDLRADLDPSSRAANDCGSISFGFGGRFVPATIGMLRASP